ncbi:MAG: hypothetical protein CMJ20_05205 [Phycisphaeraceae bacterium]|nr:hypothetical protein [Phycisphaeraceae bacterium]|tara:strand:- start:2394 stop:2909 length:516 start_codon:yes stop_codon:yes gene_type:complete
MVEQPVKVETVDVSVAFRQIRSRASLEPPKITLNLTAMIDVIFLLLIYFVVTANFTPGEGILTANLPRGSGTASPMEPPTPPLDIYVTAHRETQYQIELDQYGVVQDFDHLYDRLVSLQYDKDAGRTIGVHKPGDPIVIRPDHEVRWQHVVNAFNTAVRARYKNIAFAQTQ